MRQVYASPSHEKSRCFAFPSIQIKLSLSVHRSLQLKSHSLTSSISFVDISYSCMHCPAVLHLVQPGTAIRALYRENSAASTDTPSQFNFCDQKFFSVVKYNYRYTTSCKLLSFELTIWNDWQNMILSCIMCFTWGHNNCYTLTTCDKTYRYYWNCNGVIAVSLLISYK